MSQLKVFHIILIITSFLCFQCRSSQRSSVSNSIDDTATDINDNSCRDWHKTFKSNGEGLSKIFDQDNETDQRACTLAIENGIESILQQKDYISTNKNCLGELTCSVSTADGSKWGVLEDVFSFQPFGDKTVTKDESNQACILGKKRIGSSALYMRTAKTIALITCKCNCVN